MTPDEIERLRELIELLKYRKPADFGILLGVGLVFLVGLAFVYGGHLLGRRRQLQAARIQVDEILRQRSISPAEGRTIQAIAKAGDERDTVRILTNLSVFEQALDRFLRDTDGPVDRVGIEVLRYKLGFHRHPPGWVLRSTRGIRGGQPLLAGCEENGPAISCCVVQSRPEGLVVAPKARGDQRVLESWTEGEPIHVRFWRSDDGEYRFRSRVVSASRSHLLIDHTAELHRRERRRFFRLPFRGPIQMLPQPPIAPEPQSPEPSPVEGRIQNISAGGIAIRTAGPLPWDRLRISEKHVEPFAIAGMNCRVLRASPSPDGFDHILEFESLSESLRDRLVREVLQGQVREERARAGTSSRPPECDIRPTGRVPEQAEAWAARTVGAERPADGRDSAVAEEGNVHGAY